MYISLIYEKIDISYTILSREKENIKRERKFYVI